jgi:uncharacterized protein YbjT (DUF2867 family)
MNTSTVADRDVLVIGATGSVGGEVVRSCLQRGARIRALVRSQASADALPAGVEAVRGDLSDRASLLAAIRAKDQVFFVAPHAPDELTLGTNVLEACEERDARLVHLGVHIDHPRRLVRAFGRTMVTLLLPHYRERFLLSEKILNARTRSVVLVSTTFMQNTEVFLDELLAGSFPEPLGHKGIVLVDLRDVGEIAAGILLDDSFPDGACSISGPEILTGPQAAAVWADELGREVSYVGDDESTWLEGINRELAGHKRDDFTRTYRKLPKFGGSVNEAHLARTTELLGRAPSSYRDYVRSLLEARRGAAAASPQAAQAAQAS